MSEREKLLEKMAMAAWNEGMDAALDVALEEAAKVADYASLRWESDDDNASIAVAGVAEDIRAMKGKPTSETPVQMAGSGNTPPSQPSSGSTVPETGYQLYRIPILYPKR